MIPIIHQDEHLLVVHKPTGLATTSPDEGDCLVARVRALDPEAPRLHASSRLDAEVTGLVTFARTTRAIHALLEAREQGAYRRLYLGLAAHAPEPAKGTWESPIAIHPRDPRKRIAGPGKGEKRAQTIYETVVLHTDVALLALFPQTGRTHQLRVHAQHANTPLLGDVHYGGAKRTTLDNGRVITCRRTMLHCAGLVLPRVEGGTLTLVAPPPDDFQNAFTRLGGDASELRREAILVRLSRAP